MDQATIKSYYDQLEGIYAPQRQVIQQQVAQLPGVFNTQKSGLEQAKMNAFRDISSKARGMGVAFGGYSPSEQARDTGATYMPALANLQTSQNQQQTSLQNALASLYGEQQSKALGLATDAQKQAEANRQWQAEMNLKRESMYADQSNAASSAAKDNQTLISNALNYLGTTFEKGKNTARFYTYDNKTGKRTGYKTREQAAYDFASQTGLSYKAALDMIRKTYKTGAGK